MIGKFRNWVSGHLDFKFYPTTYINLIVALSVVPCVMFLPEKFGYENGLLENMQMVVLFTGCFFAMRSKIDKKFFYFVTMVLAIIMLREVNCGRTLFFAVPGEVNSFYSWKEIKYGWLAHPIYGAYMAYVGLYFLYNKLFLNLWDKIRNVRFPIFDVIFMIAGMVLGLYAEKVSHNFVFEEITELLFYTGLVGMIYLYSNNKSFQKELQISVFSESSEKGKELEENQEDKEKMSV